MSDSVRECLFCRMNSGDVRVRKVFEDGQTFAILDLRQPRAGHCLVIPRRHAENLFELPDVDAAASMRTVKRIAAAVREAFRPEGLSLWQSNGFAAGQEVPHFHLHVMPRWEGDQLLRIYPSRLEALEPADLDWQAAIIRSALDGG